MAGMSASGPGPVSTLDQVDKGLKETLIDALNAILSPVQEVRAAAEERIKVLEVTEGKNWREMLPQHAWHHVKSIFQHTGIPEHTPFHFKRTFANFMMCLERVHPCNVNVTRAEFANMLGWIEEAKACAANMFPHL